jgi:hypothetical protein
MAKWDDKHMYNWMGAMSFVTAIHAKILNIAMETRNLMGFIGFMMTTIIGFPIRYFMVGLMAIPQTFEWIMANLIEFIDYLISGNSEDEDSRQFRTIVGLLMALAFVLPYAMTWGLPDVVLKLVRKHKEKLGSAQRMRDVITRDEVLRNWGITVPPPPQRSRGVKAKDFKPKKYLVSHKFNKERKERYITPGVYIRETDHTWVPGVGHLPTGLERSLMREQIALERRMMTTGERQETDERRLRYLQEAVDRYRRDIR